MELNFRLYPRGFSFSDFKLDQLPEEYITQKILGKYFLSTCKYTDSLVLEQGDSFIIIHGHSTYVHHSNSISNKELSSYLLNLFFNNYNEFLNALDFLAGRYVIIIGDTECVNVFQDATASRSVYYSLKYNMIASHVNLINDNKKHNKDENAENHFRLALHWNLSPYHDIKALTPNLYLDFYSKETFRFFPRENNKYTHLSIEDRLELAEHLWKNQYEYIFENYKKMAFSITGGIDSRTSLAMIKNYTSNIKFFTYTTALPNPSNIRDRESLRNDGFKVKELLNDIPLNHTFIQLEKVSKKLSNTDMATVSRNTIGKHNFGLLRSYKKLFPDSNTLHIRSTISEIGSSHLLENERGNTSSRLIRYFVSSFSRINRESLEKFELDLNQISEQGFKDLKYDSDRFDYHIMDLYYWENRIGRWASEILNETDVCFETYSGYNLRAIIEIALSFKFEERHSHLFLRELINRNYPILNFYGINSTENLYEKNKDLIEKFNANGNDNSLKEYAQKSSEKIYEKISDLKKETLEEFMKFNEKIDGILTLNEEKINLFSENNSKLSTQKNIFSKFTLVDKEEETELITRDKHTIYLPSPMLIKGNYAEVKYIYKSQFGQLNISLCNKYKNHNAINYIKYEIRVNGKAIIEEDIAYWNEENNVVIYNLKKDDVISVRIKALRDCLTESWSNASKLIINSINEIERDSVVPVNVKVSSPYTKLLLN